MEPLDPNVATLGSQPLCISTRAPISAGEHRKWIKLIDHLEAALKMLDALDEGDGKSAAFAQRAVDGAKRELRQRRKRQ